MEETKRCPYCGEEILSVAKKCKYCGEWLENTTVAKKAMIACPICGEQIEEGLDVCPFCKENISQNERLAVDVDNSTPHINSHIEDKDRVGEQRTVQPTLPNEDNNTTVLQQQAKRLTTCPICCETIEEGLDVCPFCNEDISQYKTASENTPIDQEKLYVENKEESISEKITDQTSSNNTDIKVTAQSQQLNEETTSTPSLDKSQEEALNVSSGNGGKVEQHEEIQDGAPRTQKEPSLTTNNTVEANKISPHEDGNIQTTDDKTSELCQDDSPDQEPAKQPAQSNNLNNTTKDNTLDKPSIPQVESSTVPIPSAHVQNTDLAKHSEVFFLFYFINTFFKHYADFKGVVALKQYWLSMLTFIFLSLPFFGLIMTSAMAEDDAFFGLSALLHFIFSLIMFIPILSCTVRRLHDTGKSGWWYLVTFLPFVGPIWLLVLLCAQGKAQTRKMSQSNSDQLIWIIIPVIFFIELIVGICIAN